MVSFSRQHQGLLTTQKFGLFTLIFCRGRCGNVLIIKTHVHSHCSAINSLNLFSDLPVAVAIVVS